MLSSQQQTAPFVHTKGEGTHIWFTNSLLTIKATAEDTDGRFSLIEQLAPLGYETPYHVHHGEGHELFYVIEGTFTFYYGEESVRGTAGTTVSLPTGIPHGYRVEGDAPARILIQISRPELAGFFVEGGEPAEEPVLPDPTEPDIEALVELSERYDMEILGRLPDGGGSGQS